MYKTYPEYSHELVGSERIKNYIYGGKAVVTLKSPSGVHHTYVFEKPLEPTQFPNDVIFVYALHGKGTQFYIGMIENEKFRLTKHSRFINDAPIVKGARYIMRMIHYPNLKTPMKLYHEGTCSVCGRPLTHPKSLEFGMGYKCRKHLECQ